MIRSGGFFRYGLSVFGPERTIRLCQCLLVPNSSAPASRTGLLSATSYRPGATSLRRATSANSRSAFRSASTRLRARSASAQVSGGREAV